VDQREPRTRSELFKEVWKTRGGKRSGKKSREGQKGGSKPGEELERSRKGLSIRERGNIERRDRMKPKKLEKGERIQVFQGVKGKRRTQGSRGESEKTWQEKKD